MNRFIGSKIAIVNEVSADVDVSKIREVVGSVLKKNNAPLGSEVSIAIASDKKLQTLARNYLKESGKEARSHPVLSFASREVKGFVMPKSDKNYLGEIIISWDKALAESKEFARSPSDIVADYAAHATLHLLGIHHK